MPGGGGGPSAQLPPGAMTLPGDDTRVPTYKVNKSISKFKIYV